MDDFDLKKLHSKLLELISYFDEFCKNHGITYYLMGGSALGAVRHKGFIPWDDDFDVFMDHQNYSRFQRLAATQLDMNRFYFQNEATKEWPLYFSKIRMNNTTFIEIDVKDKNIHHGIFIDIMCLNNGSNYIPRRYIQYLAARILSAKALCEKGYSAQSYTKIIALKIANVFVRKRVKRILMYMVKRYNARQTELVCHFFGRAPFMRTSFPRCYLGEPARIQFEHLLLPVASDVDGYLKLRYGERYMEMPSEAVKSLYPSHAYIIDTEKPYQEYFSDLH